MSDPSPSGPRSQPPPVATARGGVSPVALALTAAWIGAGAAMGLFEPPPRILAFAFVILGWILAVAVHEFCHALVAFKGGDVSVEAKGYLTFDPFKYANLVTSLLLPVLALALGGIGFPGGAVYLREDLMRSRAWRSAAALAGPAGTAIVLAVLAGLLAVLRAADRDSALMPAVAFLAFLQATALILNLLPVPGLDGYGVLRPLMPDAMRAFLAPVERVAFVALFALIFLVPQASGLLFAGGFGVCRALGVPGPEIAQGLRDFRFWT